MCIINFMRNCCICISANINYCYRSYKYSTKDDEEADKAYRYDSYSYYQNYNKKKYV